MLLLLSMMLIAGCSSYFGDKVRGVDVGSGVDNGDEYVLKYGVKPFLDCDSLTGEDKSYCLDLQANNPEALDAGKCGEIQDEALRGYCRERNCLFAGNCEEKAFRVYYVDLSSQAYRRSFEVSRDFGLSRNYNYGVKELFNDDNVDLNEMLLADSNTIEFSSEEYDAIIEAEIGTGKEPKVVVPSNAVLVLFKVPENLKHAYIKLEGFLDEIPVQGLNPKYSDYSNFYVRVSGEGNKVKYVSLADRLNSGIVIHPVINGEVSFIIDTGGNKIIDRLFSEAYFAEQENFVFYPQAGGRTYAINADRGLVEYEG